MGTFKKHVRTFLIVAGSLLLGAAFWSSQPWLELCAGLALFLFGMQCLEEGLRQLAGGKLEQLLARTTATPFKGCCSASAAPCCCSRARWCRC